MFSTSGVAARGEVGGPVRPGEGSLLASRGREPFVLILGPCRVEDGEEGESGPSLGSTIRGGLRATDCLASRCSSSICCSYSAHMVRMSSSRSSLLRGRGGGREGVDVLGGRAGGRPSGGRGRGVENVGVAREERSAEREVSEKERLDRLRLSSSSPPLVKLVVSL